MGVNLGTATAYIDIDASKFNNGIKNLQNQLRVIGDSTQSTSDRFNAFGRVSQSVGRKLTTGLTLPLTGVAAASVKTAADFEKGMSEVKAITGATGTDFKKLENQAKELGSSTKFSATEAAEGMKYFGMAQNIGSVV